MTKKLLVPILIIVAAGFVIYGANQKPKENLGVSVPKIIALFDDSLQTSISSSATSMTLVRGTDKQGNDLSGFYGFVISEGSSNEEFVTANCTGVTCTDLNRGISVTTATSSIATLKYSHRRGENIKATDYPILGILRNIINGNERFPNHVGLQQDFVSATASTTDFATKKYVDTVGATGFTAANVADNMGLKVQGTAPETVGIYISATSSALIFGGIGDDQIKVNPGYGTTINAEGQLQVATSTANFIFGKVATSTAGFWAGSGGTNSLDMVGGDIYVQDDLEIDGSLIFNGVTHTSLSYIATSSADAYSYTTQVDIHGLATTTIAAGAKTGDVYRLTFSGKKTGAAGSASPDVKFNSYALFGAGCITGDANPSIYYGTVDFVFGSEKTMTIMGGCYSTTTPYISYTTTTVDFTAEAHYLEFTGDLGNAGDTISLDGFSLIKY